MYETELLLVSRRYTDLMIPTENFTDMTPACEDIDEDDESDDPDDRNVLVLLGKILKYLWSDLSLKTWFHPEDFGS